jgi:hypothetical protein
MVYLHFTDSVTIDTSGLPLRKLLTIILVLLFCGIAHSDNSNSAVVLSKKEVMRLLKGEKNITLLALASPNLKEKLKNDVHSDITLKFRRIGLEPSRYYRGMPILEIDLSLIDDDRDRYSGVLRLAFLMVAKYAKGEVWSYATVWEDRVVCKNLGEQVIRSTFKNMMDKFLSVYLKADPRKFADDTPRKK